MSLLRDGIPDFKITTQVEGIDQLVKASQSLVSIKGLKQMETKFTEMNKKMLAAQERGENFKAAKLQWRIKREMVANERMIGRRATALKEAEDMANKGNAERLKDMSEGFAGLLDDLKSGNIAGFLSKTAQGAARAGMGIKNKGDAGGFGAASGAASKMGDFLAKAGPMIAAVGAVVGALAVLGKAVLDADAQGKDFNRTLLESGVTAADITSDLYGTAEALNEVRGAFAGNLGFMVKWGVTAKEVLPIMGAFAQAGYTMTEMAEGTEKAADRMERYRDAAEVALRWSKLLGMSTTEVATEMASRMEDLGGTLKNIDEQFSMVYKSAMESGFGVKRFFSMVLQATSGMAFYNVRLEESANLLLQLGKILGTKMGGDFLQSLTKGFTDESYQARYKRVMLTGQKRMAGIFQKSAENTADSFIGKFEDKAGNLDKLSAAMKGQGLGGATGKGSDLVKELQKLDPEKGAKLIAKVRATDPDLARQLSTLIDVSKGASGRMSDMVAGMGALDQGGKLVATLNQTAALIGAPIHEMNMTQTMAFEQMTGVGGEQLMALRELSKGLTGNFKLLVDEGAEMKALAASSPAEFERRKQEQIKAYGASNDVFGNVVSAATGKQINSVEEFIQSQGEKVAEAVKEPMDAQQAATEQIVSNTTELTKYLQIGVEYFLEGIYNLMQTLVTFITGHGLEEEEKAFKAEALGQLGEDKVKLVRQRGDIDANIGGLNRQRKEAKSEDEIKEIDKKIVDEQAKKALLDLSIAANKATTEEVQSMRDSPGGDFTSAKEFKDQAFQKVRGREALEVEYMDAASGEMATRQVAPATDIAPDLMETFKKGLAPGVLDKFIAQKNRDARMSGDSTGGAIDEQAALKELFYETIGEGTTLGDVQSKIVDSQKAIDDDAKRREEVIAAKDRAHLEGKGSDKVGEAVGKELSKSQISDALGKIGLDQGDAEAYAGELAAGRMPAELKEILNNPHASGGTNRDFLLKEGFGGKSGLLGPKQNDFLLRMDSGGRVTPIVEMDRNDQMSMVGSKPGGAIDRAAGSRSSGGGGGVVNNHFYNDAKANYNQIKKFFNRTRRG